MIFCRTPNVEGGFVLRNISITTFAQHIADVERLVFQWQQTLLPESILRSSVEDILR